MLANVLLRSTSEAMESKNKDDRRHENDRRSQPGGRRATDLPASERERREQLVDKYLRKQDNK